MPNTLKIFLVVCILIFLIYVIINVKRNKLSIRNSIVWLVMGIAIIICVFQINNLEIIASCVIYIFIHWSEIRMQQIE